MELNIYSQVYFLIITLSINQSKQIFVFAYTDDDNNGIETSTDYVQSIRKCCEFQSLFINGSCIKINESFQVFPPSINVTIAFDVLLEIPISTSTYDLNCRNDTFVTKIARSRPLTSQFTKNGYLIINKSVYSPESFCLNAVEDSSFELAVCNAVCNNDYPCVPLCSENSVSSLKLYSSSVNSSKQEEGYDLTSTDLNAVESKKDPLQFHISRLDCIAQGRTFLTKYTNDLEELPNNASTGTFCISAISVNEENHTKVLSLLTCGDEWAFDEFGLSAFETHLYGICSGISLVFSLLALIIYLLLWRKQTVHTWTQFCYILSLFGVYISMILEIYSPEDRNHLCTLRYFMNVLLYRFGSNQIITWLALLSFDLFLSFWRLKPSVGRSKPSLRRFYIYAVIGWIMPLLTFGISFILDRHKWERAGYCVGIAEHPVARLYGALACLLNIVFFIATFFQILKHRRNSKFASQNASKQQNRLMSLFGKLFLITGITFSGVFIEIISKSNKNRSSIPLFAFRALICLQGLVVFVVFLCNKKTWNQFVQKYPTLKGLSLQTIGSFVTQSTKRSSIEMNSPKP